MNFICWVCGKEIGREHWSTEILVYAGIGAIGNAPALRAHEGCWRKWLAEYVRPYTIPASLDICAECSATISGNETEHAIHWTTSQGSALVSTSVLEEIAIHDRCWPQWHSTHIRPFRRAQTHDTSFSVRKLSTELRWYSEARTALVEQAIERLEFEGFDPGFVAYCRANATEIGVRPPA